MEDKRLEQAGSPATAVSSGGRFPDFLIIGTMKSGTTSLRAAIDAHPQAFCARELHFFDQNFGRGLDWYRAQFATAGAARAVGEKTPSYLYSEAAVDRLHRTVPDARLIIVLRDPVSRAYSHYWHMRRRNKERLSFEDAVEAETGRLDKDSVAGGFLAYVDQGRYLRQLERLCARFPRSSVHVVLFEDLKSNPTETFAGVCRFLGIDDAFVPPAPERRANAYREHRPRWLWDLMFRKRLWRFLPGPTAGWVAKLMTKEAEYTPMPAETRAKLRGMFAADNAALAEWLGRDLSAWDA